MLRARIAVRRRRDDYDGMAMTIRRRSCSAGAADEAPDEAL